MKQGNLTQVNTDHLTPILTLILTFMLNSISNLHPNPGWGPMEPGHKGIEALSLSARWPEFGEGTLVENQVYTDLRPLHAPIWLLTGRTPTNVGWQSRCAEGVRGILTAFSTDGAAQECDSNASEAILSSAMTVIFQHDHLLLQTESSIKGSPVGSLMARLTEYVFKRHSTLHGLMPRLWSRFVSEIQLCWDEDRELPCTMGSPDTLYCVLHQKLQLINCCIKEKVKRKGNPGIKVNSKPFRRPGPDTGTD